MKMKHTSFILLILMFFCAVPFSLFSGGALEERAKLNKEVEKQSEDITKLIGEIENLREEIAKLEQAIAALGTRTPSEGNSQPENSQLGNSQPGNSQPENSQPGNSQPENSQPENSQPGNSQPENSEDQPYLLSIISASSGCPSRNIEGDGYLNEQAIIEYIKNQNPNENPERLIQTYIREADFEGINHDIAIAQMLYATNFLRLRMTTHNYAGLSSTQCWNGSFPNMTEGVRAHIQHLKGYSSGRLNSTEPPVDRRYQILSKLGYLGRARDFDDLYGYWSPNNSVNYGNSIDSILNSLYGY